MLKKPKILKITKEPYTLKGMCIKKSDEQTRRIKREWVERKNVTRIAIPAKVSIRKYVKYF